MLRIIMSLSGLVTVSGALVYALTTGKSATLGLVAFGVGLLTLLKTLG